MEKYQEIERTIIKTYRAHLWAPFIKALKEYQLLEVNDHVGIFIFGDKKSMLIAKLFEELKKHSDFDFMVSYVACNLDELKYSDNLDLLNIKAIRKDNFNKDINSVQLVAKELGINKIVGVFNFDDVIEATLGSILKRGCYETILPKQCLDFNLELINPLYLIRNRDMTRWANFNELKFIEKPKNVEGLDVAGLIQNLQDYNPLVEKNIFKSTENVNLDKVLGYYDNHLKVTFLDDYDSKSDKEST